MEKDSHVNRLLEVTVTDPTEYLKKKQKYKIEDHKKNDGLQRVFSIIKRTLPTCICLCLFSEF